MSIRAECQRGYGQAAEQVAVWEGRLHWGLGLGEAYAGVEGDGGRVDAQAAEL